MGIKLKIVRMEVKQNRALEKDQDREWGQLDSNILSLPVEERSGPLESTFLIRKVRILELTTTVLDV